MFRNLFLLLFTNVAVMAVAYTVITVLGIEPYLTAQGINYLNLFIFSSIFGFGGAFISLWMSKWLAKTFYKIRMIETPANPEQQWLKDTVILYAKQMNIPVPEIGVYENSEVNAFATGSSKKNSLVAFSTGLLNKMDKKEIEGVIGHEIAHIANNDMVTMSLIQGIVNTFVIFISRVAAHLINSIIFRGRLPYFGYFAITLALQIAIGILAQIVVMWFSRRREFRADALCAKHAGKDVMISSLQCLQKFTGYIDTSKPEMATLKISNRSTFASLFCTHPPLELRIKKLQQI